MCKSKLFDRHVGVVWQQPSLADPADLQRELDMCDAMSWPQWIWAQVFFLLHAAKVRSSCEEGPGQSALQSAYHDPKVDVTEMKQHRTP